MYFYTRETEIGLFTGETGKSSEYSEQSMLVETRASTWNWSDCRDDRFWNRPYGKKIRLRPLWKIPNYLYRFTNKRLTDKNRTVVFIAHGRNRHAWNRPYITILLDGLYCFVRSATTLCEFRLKWRGVRRNYTSPKIAILLRKKSKRSSAKWIRYLCDLTITLTHSQQLIQLLRQWT